MSNLVAIHQPNFFPWLGYFDKIARSDVFIFLDHVQMPKTGGAWTNRVKMMAGREARWATAPLARKFHGVRAINQMEFELDNPWREKILKSVQLNYAKTPFFKETFELIEPLLLNPENNLALYNRKAIISIADSLGLPRKKFRCSSEMDAHGQSNELLVSLTIGAAGNAYMCGGGATGYQDDHVFLATGLNLVYQGFLHPVYPQRGRTEFTAGLSIIDALMNIGLDGVGNLLDTASKKMQED